MQITLAGFPRSGNTFLRYALFNMYPNCYFNRPIHTVRFLEEYNYNDKIVMPVRQPKDCIASWIELKSILINEQTYENKRMMYDTKKTDNAIKYYIRYFNYVLSCSDRFLFLDFNKFTNDLKYVSKNLNKEFDINVSNNISVEYVKNILREKEAFTQIPRDDKTNLNMIKLDVTYNNLLLDANILYEKIQHIMEENNV